MSLKDRLKLKLKVKNIFPKYGYNAGPPMAIPIYTVLPYCVIYGARQHAQVVGSLLLAQSFCRNRVEPCRNWLEIAHVGDHLVAGYHSQDYNQIQQGATQLPQREDPAVTGYGHAVLLMRLCSEV